MAVSEPGITGEPYEDGSGNRYLPMFRQPVLVFEANRAAVKARSREELELVGCALHGSRGLVDKVVKGLQRRG